MIINWYFSKAGFYIFFNFFNHFYYPLSFISLFWGPHIIVCLIAWYVTLLVLFIGWDLHALRGLNYQIVGSL